MAEKKSKTKKTQKKVVTVIGTPTAVLLPARNYKFKVYSEKHLLKVPAEGKYSDFDSELFTERDGEFDFLQYSEEDQSFTLFIPALSKILFATSQYPDMADGQAFTPISITVKNDEVHIVGNLIEMVPQEK